MQSSGVEDTQLSQDVEYVCGTMEAVFLHELKNSKVRHVQCLIRGIFCGDYSTNVIFRECSYNDC